MEWIDLNLMQSAAEAISAQHEYSFSIGFEDRLPDGILFRQYAGELYWLYDYAFIMTKYDDKSQYISGCTSVDNIEVTSFGIEENVVYGTIAVTGSYVKYLPIYTTN